MFFSAIFPLGKQQKKEEPTGAAAFNDALTYVLGILCLSTLCHSPCPPVFLPFSPHPLSAFIGFETNNQYEIKNSLGQKIYKAKEKNDCCTRNCCGSLRSFDMKIKDNADREVIRLIRPFRCVSCWCPCCLQEVCTWMWVCVIKSLRLSEWPHNMLIFPHQGQYCTHCIAHLAANNSFQSQINTLRCDNETLA